MHCRCNHIRGRPWKADVSITNSEINLCSQGNGAAPSITLMPGASNVNIQGNRIGNNTYPQLNARESPYGIQLSGNNSNIRIIGNDFTSQRGGHHLMLKPILLQGAPGENNIFFANIPLTRCRKIQEYKTFRTESTSAEANRRSPTRTISYGLLETLQPRARIVILWR